MPFDADAPACAPHAPAAAHETIDVRARGVTFIINQGAGSAPAQDLADELRSRCEALGLRADPVLVRSGDDICERVGRALRDRAGAVVAGGGDGTVSAVASCVAGTGVPMGVLPLGTLNHFAKDLGIPSDLTAALEVIAGGRVAPIDAAEVNGRIFVNNSSLGLYPDIVRHREQQQHRLGRGKWRALVSATWQALERSSPLTVRIELPGTSLLRRTGFLFIGNNEYCLGGLQLGARATVQGGCLSLAVTRSSGRMAMLRLALRALLGRLGHGHDLELVKTASVTVRTSRPSVHVATDGEVQLMETPLHYRALPGALRVFVPGEPEHAARAS